MTLTEENATIALAVSGDTEAFGRLYCEHRSAVFILLQRLTHNREDAEDLTSETFLKVWEKLSSFQGKSRLATWLHRIAYNIFCMSVRYKKLRPVPCELDTEQIVITEIGHRKAELDNVRLALSRLPEKQRGLLVMREIYGFSTQESADFYHTSPSAIKATLYRARARMRDTL
jgi:RNA polymerase sigma-70 factor (ECF subfamily)